ncbi:hypothetical protein HDV03_001846 [Kappamyces sp. JEL0829]|nr:hypothetical protein HDV03_001846 [Kappamyces sp. JEL0829]
MKWQLASLGHLAPLLAARIALERGFAPESQPSNKAEWVCDGGATVLPIAWVNDDYCDCKDGSDESGTSACPNSRFYCPQEGHEPKWIPSHFVDDRLCDCCDGSDEIALACPNVCKAIAAEANARKSQEQARMKTGIQNRAKLIQAAKDTIASNARSAAKKQAQLEQLHKQTPQLQMDLDLAAARASAAREEKEKERRSQCWEIEAYGRELEESQRLRNRIAELESAKVELQVELDHHRKWFDEAYETMQSGAVSPDILDQFYRQGEQEADEESLPRAEEAEEPAVADKADNNQPASDEAASGREPDKTATLARCHRLLGYCIPDSLQAISKSIGLIPDEQKAQQRLQTHQEAIQALEKEIRDLELNGGKDYGVDNVWASLDSKCFSLDSLEYTYEVCLFGKASQKSKQGHSTVDLGTFSRFGTRDGTSSNNTMLFENGQGCWNGPLRSVEVHFDCGPETLLVSVGEPGRCEYVVQAQSPAVCQDGLGTVQHDEL